MPDEALLELIKATRSDLVDLRDNHLTHIQDDVTHIKETVSEINYRVTALEEAYSLLKAQGWKIAGFLIFVVFGVDMGMEQI